MAQKHIIEQQQREDRKLQYLARPTLADQFPKVEECRVDLRFVDPARKVTPSPYRQIFVPEMRVYFDFKCPLRDCVDGGFDLNAEILSALSKRSAESAGTLTCAGKRKNASTKPDCCGLELQYRITVRGKEKRAAR